VGHERLRLARDLYSVPDRVYLSGRERMVDRGISCGVPGIGSERPDHPDDLVPLLSVVVAYRRSLEGVAEALSDRVTASEDVSETNDSFTMTAV